ncbi:MULTISPECIES: hypothetical protein [unclassified Streptomyces]|uniref:hypothetical protein n=1 Tax=unclassified Streptomyces TaxID=2593676 RepID=UPI0030149A5C
MAKHTTVLAAVVAAAGLAVTAWGTVKSAQVADDQLAQSKERQAQEERKLAARVTSWLQPEATVIANRSLDPAVLYLRVLGHPSLLPGSRAVLMLLGTAPPCTRLEVPDSLIKGIVKERTGFEVYGFQSLIIVEPSGNLWERRPGGALREPEFETGWRITTGMAARGKEGKGTPPGKELLTSSLVKSSGLEECGSAM